MPHPGPGRARRRRRRHEPARRPRVRPGPGPEPGPARGPARAEHAHRPAPGRPAGLTVRSACVWAGRGRLRRGWAGRDRRLRIVSNCCKTACVKEGRSRPRARMQDTQWAPPGDSRRGIQRVKSTRSHESSFRSRVPTVTVAASSRHSSHNPRRDKSRRSKE